MTTCFAADNNAISLDVLKLHTPSKPWEYPVRGRENGYTYFFPLDESMVGEPLEVVLLGMKGGGSDLQPTVWLTARDLPFTAKRQKLAR